MTKKTGFEITEGHRKKAFVLLKCVNTYVLDCRIWKRFVDDTFTILECRHVDSLLDHLNDQQPFRFSVETENDYKLAFVDSAVSREPDGLLTTGVYRKPTHTDQYLVYDSYQPR